MHLRRALLLFAIVLGTAALVASLSRPADHRRSPDAARDAAPPTAVPLPASGPAEPVSFDASAGETRRIRTGRAATVEVAVTEAGNVEIPELGLSAPAAPLTPARFELFPSRPGEHEILFTPAARGEAEPAGRLVVTSAG